ncbi:Wzz/FepE/Etk N-terminal domain-containing protein [Litorivicinus sp.]|nr:Wzz/FepE/Etk N-terminal domain-containing protein [Litorivicinus sp.]
MNDSDRKVYADDEIDLFGLIGVIWSGKWLIILFSMIAAGLSIYTSLQIPNSYRVEIKIAPVDDGGGKMAGLMSQYGSLASLAGISLPSSGDAQTDLLLKILQSRRFISDFIKEEGLGPRLLALSSYDPVQQVELIDSNIFNAEQNQWLRKVEAPRSAEPSEQELFEAFASSFQIYKDNKSPLVTVSFDHQSPLLGYDILRLIVTRLDDYARQKDRTKSEQSIEYLERKLSQTRLVDVEKVLYQMIEAQVKTLMLAEVNADYAFQIIDPAHIPETKTGPVRSLIVITSTFVGGMIAILGVFIRAAFRKRVMR